MTQAAPGQFPSLFSHQRRADWGVGVLSGERDGKRSYLFEDGEERVMGAGGIELMRKVEHPNRDQQTTCAHLMGLLAKRKGSADPGDVSASATVVKQLERFHKKYTGGFFGKGWKEDEKGMHVRQTRVGIAPKLRQQLAADEMSKLIAAEQFDALWRKTALLLGETGLATGKLPATLGGEQREQRALAETMFALLHGSDSYERRFDRFAGAYESAFRQAPTWQAATALPALMSPEAHVYVDPTSFRKQLRALSRYSAFAARPSGTAYARCLGMAQALANMLAARGEVPRDLLDVHDFVRATV